jgi:ribA/ribD-fused uncharacterized protein
MKKSKITQFRGEYGWLSNFAMVEIKLHGHIYSSVEHAYIASKSSDEQWRELCADDKYSAGQLKQESKNIKIIENWDDIKVDIMKRCLVQKFIQEPYKTKLINTAGQIIEEGNYWNDKFWGICLKTNEGENMLGKLIMELRKLLITIESKKQ